MSINKSISNIKEEVETDEEDLAWRLEAELQSQNFDEDDRRRRASSSTIVTITRQPVSSLSRGENSESSDYGRPWCESRMFGEKIDWELLRPPGLASLSVSASVIIEAEPWSWNCDWDGKYSIKDEGFPEAALMFRAIEELQCCAFGSLQNIVLRDPENQPVARVCYKEKSWMTGQLVLAFYAPPDLLIGTGEESTHFGLCCSPRFQLRNANGEELFTVEYNRQVCSGESQFCIEHSDGATDVAQILSKSGQSLRLRFSAKTGLTVKIILLGFCIGILHKNYTQKASSGIS